MTSEVVQSVPFLEDDKKYRGVVDVVRTTYADRTVIGVRLRVGGHTIPLPRNKLSHVIRALQEAEAAASSTYQQLLEEMNP